MYICSREFCIGLVDELRNYVCFCCNIYILIENI